MAKAFTTWTTLTHEPIRELTETLWTCEGSLPGMALVSAPLSLLVGLNSARIQSLADKGPTSQFEVEQSPAAVMATHLPSAPQLADAQSYTPSTPA